MCIKVEYQHKIPVKEFIHENIRYPIFSNPQ
jgi:hypothetical protein